MLNSKKADRKPQRRTRLNFNLKKKRKLKSGEAEDTWEENKRLYKEIQV